MVDGRALIKRLLDPTGSDHVVTPGNLLDENSNQVYYEASYEMAENHLYVLFHRLNLDLIFLIKKLGMTPLDSPSGPVAYQHRVGIQPVTIDKYSANGAIRVNGVKLAADAVTEVRKMVRENMSGSFRTVSGERGIDVFRAGSSLIYADTIEVTYTEYVDDY